MLDNSHTYSCIYEALESLKGKYNCEYHVRFKRNRCIQIMFYFRYNAKVYDIYLDEFILNQINSHEFVADMIYSYIDERLKCYGL